MAREGTECIPGVLGAGGSHRPRDRRSFREQVQPALCLNASGLPWPGAQGGHGVAEERAQVWGQWVVTAPWQRGGWLGPRAGTTAPYST